MPETYEQPYYTPEEITPQLLSGAVDETQPRLSRVTEFAERLERDSENIEIEVMIEQYDEAAHVVGFSDSSILVDGMKATRRVINPFHIRNASAIKAGDRRGEVMRQGDGFVVSQDAINRRIAYLERRRSVLQRIALLSMINDRQFTYNDPERKIKISIPYVADIGKMAAVATKIGAAGFNMTAYLYATKSEFYKASGQVPTHAFMNSKTGGKAIEDPGLRAAFEAAQSSDPDNSGRLFDSFTYGGINFNILHEQYPLLDGTLKDPIDDGRIVWTVEEVEGTGEEAGSPFKILSAENIFNNDDAGSPYFDSYHISDDPFQIGVRMYDNMIPTILKKNIVMQQDSVYS